MTDIEAGKILFTTSAIEADALNKAFGRLTDEAFNKAVGMLAKAERIGASGCGHSGIACMHFAHLMCCIERPTRFISPSEAIHGATGFLQENDVIVFVSRGGQTSELLNIIPICKRKKISIIVITENIESDLAKSADIVLPIDITRETDKYDSQGTTSFTVVSVLFHALQAALIEVIGYKNEQFAVIHPGGAVGKRLNK
jgi:D-arabinose 5-phosphate isomerase GutQ